MKREAIVVAAMALLFAGAAFGAANASRAVTPSATATGSPTVTAAFTVNGTQDNTVTGTQVVTGTTNDSGGNDVVCATIFDDGALKASQCFLVPVGTMQTISFTLKWTGPIGQIAPGVGLEIVDATSTSTPGVGPIIASIDPLFLKTVDANIPTLDPAMLIALAVLLLGAGVWMYRRNRA
jgi:hypothetical protein